ncbi:MAG: hypothetical protein V7642_3014 [Burkholderiales bacterium]
MRPGLTVSDCLVVTHGARDGAAEGHRQAGLDRNAGIALVTQRDDPTHLIDHLDVRFTHVRQGVLRLQRPAL